MNPIYRRKLNEISLNTYGKKFDDLSYTKQSEIIEKAEGFEAVQFNQNEIRKGDYVVLFGLELENRAHMILARSENIDVDMRDLFPLVSPLIKGKGGGRSSLVEIAGEEKQNLKSALDKAYDHIKKLKV